MPGDPEIELPGCVGSCLATANAAEDAEETRFSAAIGACTTDACRRAEVLTHAQNLAAIWSTCADCVEACGVT